MNTKSFPRVTVLLPTHNRADVVGFAIKSVLAQTLSDWELFVVGDGCTDDTEGIVTQFAKKDQRVKWLPFAKGKGFGYGHRNTALKTAQGEFMAFAAHDDLWFPDHLEHLVSLMEEKPETSVVYTRPIWVHPDGTFLPSTFNTDIPEIKDVFLHDHNEIPAACVLHSRRDMEAVGGWNANLPQAADWDLWKRIILRKPERSIVFLPTPTTLHFRANWRTEENSMDFFLKDMWEQIGSNPDWRERLRTAGENKKSKLFQEVVWKKMQDPIWVETIRKDLWAFLDFRSREIREPQALVNRNLELEKNIARITSSKGYRLLEMARGWAKSRGMLPS